MFFLFVGQCAECAGHPAEDSWLRVNRGAELGRAVHSRLELTNQVVTSSLF